MSKMTLFLLGQPRIARDGIAVTVDTRKAIALISYVAITHQQHSREALAALLWPEYDHVRAFANLRRTVWALNKALSGDYLHVDRDTIGLNATADLWLDVDRFTELLQSYQMHGHPETEVCATCLEMLTEAVELYRGDFLQGFTLNDSPGFDDWQFFQAESLRRDFAHALERLVRGYRARDEFEAAIPFARRWLALDVLHEPAHRTLMELYAKSGQHSAALRQYRECVRALEEDLGVAPQEATVQLYQAIKAKQQSPASPVSRSELESEFVPRLERPDNGQDIVPPVVARAHHLPAQPDPFVGRVEELAEIGRLIRDPACRLLSLVGPGGIGKTRLALQAAAQQVDTFVHGIYFVPCGAVNSTTSLISTIADALRFSFYGAGDPKRQLLDFLRPKKLLMMMDSAEQLASALDLLTEILIEAPAVKVLATSIERFNLREEWTLEIQGLHSPEQDKDPEAEQYSAVQLFIQSARRTHAGFVPNEEDKPYIVRICRLVAGMPLGIELAASWLRVLSCREIVREVEQNLDFLATSLRNVPDRHRSMRAVFEHSWNLLSEQEQHVLGRLAIFREGFRREAAEQVAGARLPLLLGLVDKSLLRRNASGRYEMLGVIRQYAEAKLSEASRDAAQSLHCAYYVDFLHQQGQSIKGGPQQEALAEIQQELENIRAAWIWAVEHGRRREIYICAINLFLFFDIQSRFQEGEELFRRVAERLSTLSDPDSAADALLIAQIQARQGGLSYRLGRNEQAVQLLREALTLFHAVDALEDLAFCLNCLGDIARIKGQYDEARALLEESLAICAQTGDRGVAARAYTNLGVVAGASGEYREARQLFQETLAIFQALGDHSGEIRALANLGIIAYYLHEYDEAQKLLHAGLTTAQAIGNHYGIAIALNNLGIVAYAQGQYADSKKLHQESCAIFEQIGYRLGAGLTLNDLGQVARALGDNAASRSYFLAALRTASAIQATPLALDVLVGIATLFKETEPERALELSVLASRHPASGKETRDRATHLLGELGGQVYIQDHLAVEEELPTNALQEVIEQLLGE